MRTTRDCCAMTYTRKPALQLSVLLLRLIGLTGRRIQTCTFALFTEHLALVLIKAGQGQGPGDLHFAIGHHQQMLTQCLPLPLPPARLLGRQHGVLGFLQRYRGAAVQLRVRFADY